MTLRKQFVLSCLTLLTTTSLVRAQPLSPAHMTSAQKARLQEALGPDRSWAEGKQDPPGVLNNAKMDSVRQTALRLSSNRGWLTTDVLKNLDKMSVRLDEIFSEAPQLVKVDNRLYRIVLEKVGPRWKDFDPRTSEYLVFLDHDTFDGYGESYALAFQNGQERKISEQDIMDTAAIGLSLKGVTPDEKPAAKSTSSIVSLDQPIRMGKVRPQFRSTAPIDIASIVNRKDTCLQETAPVSCSGGVPVCSSPNASPYFVLSSLLIKTDHEGLFKGDPEIELYPLRINPSSPYGGSTDVRTNWIFSGRTVTDLAGRSRYLPDINNTYTWYGVSGGLALFPLRMSNEWAATLVDDDDTAGKLEIDRDKANPVKTREALVKIYPFDLFDFLKDLANLVITLGFLNDSDDLYTQSLEVSNQTFCSEALGQYFPYTLTFDSDEWTLQGYYSCIDPTCVPPPPDSGGGGGCLTSSDGNKLMLNDPTVCQ
ncbi:MAG: hypothetical protein ACJ76Y_32415 [Thermoanaerobaculia bacterium]